MRLNDSRLDPSGYVVGGIDAQQCEPGQVIGRSWREGRHSSSNRFDAALTIHRREVGISNTLAWIPTGVEMLARNITTRTLVART